MGASAEQVPLNAPVGPATLDSNGTSTALGVVDRVISDLRIVPLQDTRLTRLLRFGVSPFLFVSDTLGALIAALATGIHVLTALLAWALTVLLLIQAGTYRSRLTKSVLDQLPSLVVSPLIAAAVVACFGALTSQMPGDLQRLVVAGFSYATLLVIGRLICDFTVRKSRQSGLIAHRTLVLGAGLVGREITRCLQDRKEFGIRPVAVWDTDPLLPEDEFGVPLISGNVDLAALITAVSAKVVIIAFGGQRESEMVSVLRTCDRMDCEIFVVPRLFELCQRDAEMEEVWGTPLVRLRRPAYRLTTWRLKRVMDVVVTTALLIPLAPLMALVALAVRLEGGEGVIFRQQRVGLDGRTFDVLKFRSLRPVDEAEASTTWSVSTDHRVGPVGKILRRTSFDELPQLWNVVRGDMTLVGPRPERPFFVKQFSRENPRYVARHRVPSGVTGWAQIHGLRGDTSIHERAAFDNYYIENWSLWLDVKILLRTVLAILRREGG